MSEHDPAPSPGRAVYGFVMWLSFRVFLILYLVWALVPDEWFRELGITCLPRRYAAVSIPIFLLTCVVVFGCGIYPGMGLFLTPDVDHWNTITDPYSIKDMGIEEDNEESSKSCVSCTCIDDRCNKRNYERDSGDFKQQKIPQLRDLDISEVSEMLYLR